MDMTGNEMWQENPEMHCDDQPKIWEIKLQKQKCKIK
jgi:hypothetical protein